MKNESRCLLQSQAYTTRNVKALAYLVYAEVEGGEVVKTTVKYDRLLNYMYDEYDIGHNDHKRGERVRVLVERFERNSQKNRIGNANGKKAAITYHHDRGLIDLVDTTGNTITDHNEAYVTGRMKPTQNGRDYLQKMQTDNANKIASDSGTFFGKLFKKVKPWKQ